MSHWVNDRIADNAIDTVANMSDNQVSQILLKVGKGTQFLVGPLADMDKARDILIDLVFDDLMSIPGPHG